MAEECKAVEDVQARLKDLFGHTIEQSLEAEMDEHLAIPSIARAATTLGIAGMATARRR